MGMNNTLEVMATVISGKYYRVEDYPFEKVAAKGIDVLKKGIAYRYDTDMLKALLPFRGLADDDATLDELLPGIWYRALPKGRKGVFLVPPHTAEEREQYALGKEKNIMSAMVGRGYTPDQFVDPADVRDYGGEIFMPPAFIDDDALNVLMKTAIRAKEAPFEPYGKRLEQLAVDKTKKTSGTNERNNTKRALKSAHAMSAGKFMTYANTWQLEPCFILRDHPDALHPMFEDGQMLVYFPGGVPFKIDPSKLVDITDMVADAISRTSVGGSNSDDDEEE